MLKSSHPEVICKKGVLRNFTKFSGKYVCQSLFFNKVAVLSFFQWSITIINSSWFFFEIWCLSMMIICSKAVYRRCSIKKVFLEISQNPKESNCDRAFFFDNVMGLRAATLVKERLWHKSFPVNFVKFLKAPFLTEHLWWLLLYALQSLFFIMYMQKRLYQIFCRFYFDHL